MVAILVGFVSMLADMFMNSLLWGGRRDEREGNGSTVLMIVGVVFVILSPIIATMIQLAISRKREYLADASAALLTRYPDGLASALRKISAYGHPMTRASNATAHMYIANPFGNVRKGLSGLFMTHPPVEKRIKALTDMAI
jgi:heat shock protein HtpX